MAVIPKGFEVFWWHEAMRAAGFILLSNGKVRETWIHPDFPNLLFIIATDRLSIFDFVLPVLVDRKGASLTMSTMFWLTGPLKNFPNHLSTGEHSTEKMLERFPCLPPEQTMVVRKLSIQPWELIFRANLGGSVWADYEKTGIVSGQKLPEGLKKWSKLEHPLFTPSTKAEVGHDENITAESYFRDTGEAGHFCVSALQQVFGVARDYLKKLGLVFLDTKFETQLVPFCLGDEILTSDSSRISTEEDLPKAIAEGREPISFDKQPMRDWGQTLVTPWGKGLKGLSTADPAVLEFIANLEVPEDKVDECTSRYVSFCQRLICS